jgi:hypothetical protein
MNARQPRSLRARLLLGVTAILALFTAAPTPGDTGGCQPARPLDESAFFQAKRNVDCDRCQECEITSQHCSRACDDERIGSERFPDGCAPLAHDGAVCLRALLAASCDDYGAYVNDDRPQLPSECDFCPYAERTTSEEPQ